MLHQLSLYLSSLDFINLPQAGLKFNRRQGTKGNRLFINLTPFSPSPSKEGGMSCMRETRLPLLQRQQGVKIIKRMEQLVVIHNQGQMMLANLHRCRHTFKM